MKIAILAYFFLDNTNETYVARKIYIELAKKLQIPIRCFHFSGSEDLAKHNNLYQSFIADPPSLQPLAEEAFKTYANAFQSPTLDEGFTEIKTIEGYFDGEDRTNWEKWLQVDGA